MELLDRLLGRSRTGGSDRGFSAAAGATTQPEAPRPAATGSPTTADEPKPSFGAAGDRFVRVRALDFFGPYARSPNGRFVLAWRDADEAGGRGGHRDGGPGRHLLFDDGRLVASGRCERPNDGQVADDGTFSLNDWRFGEGLKGTYRASGEPIVEREFAANLFNAGISPDGRLGACQTCNAPGSADSSLLTVFDLRRGVQLAAFVPEGGWADGYSFPADGVIRLHDRTGPSHDYGMDGRLLDRGAWIASLGALGRVHQLAALLEAEGREIAPEIVGRALDGLGTAVASADFDERFRPMALKATGRCRELLGDLPGAVASYREALALDTRIGLKRRIAQLERRLAGERDAKA